MISSLDTFVTAESLLNGRKLRAGDVVEIDRIVYSHWILYVGNQDVVHVAGVDSDIPAKDAYVIKAKLCNVARKSLVRINNKIVPARERGLTSLPCDVTIQRALAMVDKKVKFNLMTMNSEHYVTQWKYGDFWSDQAEAAFQGVFSSSPETDPKKAHHTMRAGLKTLLHFAQHPEQRGTSRRKRKTFPVARSGFLSSLSKQLSPNGSAREATP